jgi:effector-binding domain-containing protein
MMSQNFIELFNYIPEQGYHVVGHSRIQYVEGSWNQKDPSKWLTIIQVPVESLSSKMQIMNNT